MPISHRRFLTAAFLIAATTAIPGCKKPDAAQGAAAAGAPPRPVTIAIARTADVPVYLDEIGRTAPSELVNIQPQVSGQIMERHFTDGDELHKDQLLFIIDKRPFQAKVTEAEANVELARSQLELAQADYARTQKAAAARAVSPEDLDTKKGTLDNTQAQIKVNQTILDTAKLNLSYCTINSPIEGRAGQRLVDVGNIVKTNDTTLLTIQRISPIYADFTIVESDLPRVRTQMDAGTLQTLVSLPQTPNTTRPGTLTFLDTAVQPGAGRVSLRATLPNEDRYFWPGQFVKVRLVLTVQKNAVLIPYACTQMGQQGPYVYIVQADNKVVQRPVVVGQHQSNPDNPDEDLVVITAGIAEGDRVVRTGQLSISAGGTVQILPSATAPQNPAQSPPATAGAITPTAPESRPTPASQPTGAAHQ